MGLSCIKLYEKVNTCLGRLAPELECITKREESGNRCSRFSVNQGAPRGGLLRYTTNYLPMPGIEPGRPGVPSYCGLWGNERADVLAKKGTGVLQNFRRDLTLHSAKLEIKRIFRESFRLTASRVVREKPWSTLCKKSHGIPSSPRAAAVAKFRLLTGHDCLCAHLFRFNLVTSPICVLCDTAQDMTAAHLDECSALNDLNCISNALPWLLEHLTPRHPGPTDIVISRVFNESSALEQVVATHSVMAAEWAGLTSSHTKPVEVIF
ncbi:uncharacterized protein TNCV_580131 [Trichonephila clavipes]|nr:uncharacterized protein TNCV_580131 [Trichonephila clavipes]